MDNLFQRLSAEVSYLQHVFFRLFGQIFDRMNVCSLQAVVGTNGKVHFLNRHLEHLLLFVVFRLDKDIHTADRFAKVYEQSQGAQGAGPDMGAGAGAGYTAPDDDIVDGDFREV